MLQLSKVAILYNIPPNIYIFVLVIAYCSRKGMRLVVAPNIHKGKTYVVTLEYRCCMKGLDM